MANTQTARSEATSATFADQDALEAVRRSAFAIATHKAEDFDGMRRAGRLAAEALDLLVP